MSVRVIAGLAKGRRLKVPSGSDIRPTTDRAKQILFDILGHDVQDRQVTDLFAGSGALGIEALSRGAKGATFVDSDASACRTITENLDLVGFEAQVIRSDVARALAKGIPAADLVFLDPPYRTDLGSLSGLLDLLASSGSVAREGIVVVEYGAVFEWPSVYSEVRRRPVGSTVISIARLDGNHSDISGNV